MLRVSDTQPSSQYDINYVMLFSSFLLFISFQVAINSHLCSLCHGDIPPSLMVLFMLYRYGVGQVVGAPASREGTRIVAERTARVMKDSPYEEVMFGYSSSTGGELLKI